VEDNAYLTSIVAGAFYVIVGVRLLRLSRRTREAPECLLGLYFAFSGAYYLGYNLPSLLGFGDWSPGVGWLVEWTYVVGVFPYLLFIRRVFRPRKAWAAAVVGICSVFLLLGTGIDMLQGEVNYALDNPWFLIQWVGYTTPGVWMGGEALLSTRGAGKRVRIGLCAPIVANRYLLLAMFGTFQTLACVGDLSLANELGSDHAISRVSDALIGGSEIASVAVLWLAFFPPRAYSAWIARPAASAVALNG